MGSYKGESSVFTGNSTGGSPGESAGIKRDSMPGGTHMRAFTQDNVHGVNLKNTMGKELGGSETNLAHSLSGASAVEVQPGAPRSGKRTTREI